MAATRRHQSSATSNLLQNEEIYQAPEDKLKTKPRQLLNGYIWVSIFIFHAILYSFIEYRSHTFPEPKTVAKHLPGDFVEERAKKYLVDFTGLGSGTKPVGSYENEVLAVEYLMREISKINSTAKRSHHIDMDIQKTTGSFTLKFLGEFSSYYENINNVLVKLSPVGGAKNSLLVNCHYDTQIDSPGASDDIVSCCLMLEVLHVLSQSDTPLKHNIVFLFNGAEENILQASHGFITQHPWASDIKAFVNLEGAGAGGREFVFQTGPSNPWLIRTYANVAKHPFASIIGQEVFEAGIIPSDTDYRIFRDYGKIPGIDIAYIHNGYVYHTKFDNVEMIPPGCIQRGGENLLEIVKALGMSPLLPDPGEDKHGSMVFYDFVGYFMILYPQRIGTIINTIFVALVLLGIGRKVVGRNGQGLSGGAYVQQLLKALLIVVASWVITLVVVLCLALFLEVIGHPQTWFTNRWLLIGLYITPAVTVMITFHAILRKKVYYKQGNMWIVERLYFDANMLIMSTFLALLTFSGVDSACIILQYVVFPMILRDILPSLLKINFKDNQSSFMFFHLCALSVPTLLFTYLMYAVLDLFVPVMGRIGTGVIPDLVIGGMVGFSVVFSMGYQVGLVYITRSLKKILFILGAITVITYILAIFTPVGFPYRANPSRPTRQRHILHHLDRKFHDISGSVTKSDSGVLLIPLDPYELAPLRPIMPELNMAKLGKCEGGPYCGWPYYFPLLGLLKKVYLVPGPPLNVSIRPKIEKLERENMGGGIERFTFHITGPNHINMYLMSREGVTLNKWSVGSGDPHPTQRTKEEKLDTYFIFYSYGTKPDKPWVFWVDCKVDEGVNRAVGILEVALSGHYTFGDDRHTPQMTDIISRMPDWTYPVGWSATYEAWVY